MSESEKSPQIFSLMGKIMAEISPVSKDRKNIQQNYSFRGIDDMYNAVQPILAKYGVFCMPSYSTPVITERKSKNGGAIFDCSVTGVFTFYAPDGSSVSTTVPNGAMDSGDKAVSKALSGAYKYALMQVFCIPTDEPKDSENDTHEVRYEYDPQPPVQKAAKPEPKPALKLPDDLDASDPLSDADTFYSTLLEKFLENGYSDREGDEWIAKKFRKNGLPAVKDKEGNLNLAPLKYLSLAERKAFIQWVESNPKQETSNA